MGNHNRLLIVILSAEKTGATMNAVEKYLGIVKVENLINNLGIMTGQVRTFINTKKDSVKVDALTLLNTRKANLQSNLDAIADDIAHVDKDYEAWHNEGREENRNQYNKQITDVRNLIDELKAL